MIHLTLPSNASLKKFPGNTVSGYTTALAAPLDLSGEWEVGLSEISFPHSFYGIALNADNAGGNVLLAKSPHFELSILPGTYKDVGSFLSTFEAINSSSTQVVKYGSSSIVVKITSIFRSVAEDGVTYNTFKTDTEDPHKPFSQYSSLSFTEAGLRCFTPKYGLMHRKADDNVDCFLMLDMKDFTGGRKNDYIDVHCDVIRPSAHGEELKQIIRRVPVELGTGVEGAQTTIFPRIFYFPLNRNPISTLRIEFKDSDGAPIPFNSGTASVTLSFRKRTGAL